MGLFSNNTQNQNIPQTAVLTNRLRSASVSLILVVVCSALNVILSILEQDIYFLFSASFPYFLSIMGGICLGKFQGYIPFEITPNPSLGGIFIAIAIILIALYLISWILSKKHVGWLITALVMFSIDTLIMFLLYGIDVTMILDIIFHIWVLVSLSLGVHAHFKLKSIPEEQPDNFGYSPNTASEIYNPTAENIYTTAKAEPESSTEETYCSNVNEPADQESVEHASVEETENSEV